MNNTCSSCNSKKRQPQGKWSGTRRVKTMASAMMVLKFVACCLFQPTRTVLRIHCNCQAYATSLDDSFLLRLRMGHQQEQRNQLSNREDDQESHSLPMLGSMAYADMNPLPWQIGPIVHRASRARIVPPPETYLDYNGSNNNNNNDPSRNQYHPRDQEWQLEKLLLQDQHLHHYSGPNTEPSSLLSSSHLPNRIGENPHHDDTSRTMSISDRLLKTGTTIVGIRGWNYVILAADTRSTAGTMVADRTVCKLHPLAANLAAAGAGTAADLDQICRTILYRHQYQQAQLSYCGNANRIIRPMTDHSSSVSLASSYLFRSLHPVPITMMRRSLQESLWEQKGTCEAYLIVGGVDPPSRTDRKTNQKKKHTKKKKKKNRAYLMSFHPHGSIDDDLPFCALGSGGMAAMSVLEQGYYSCLSRSQQRQSNTNDNNKQIENVDSPDAASSLLVSLSKQEALDLAVRAVQAGIDHDLGSGSQVDVCIFEVVGNDDNNIDMDSNNHNDIRVQYLRGIRPEQDLPPLLDEGEDEEMPMMRLSGPSHNGHEQQQQQQQQQLQDMEEDCWIDTHAPGVNGFGNHRFAYRIRSKRVLRVSHHRQQEAIQNRWQDLVVGGINSKVDDKHS